MFRFCYFSPEFVSIHKQCVCIYMCIYTCIGRIIHITDDVIDYREWIRENFEHLTVVDPISPLPAYTNGAAKYVIMPSGAVVHQIYHPHAVLQPHALAQPYHTAVSAAAAAAAAAAAVQQQHQHQHQQQHQLVPQSQLVNNLNLALRHRRGSTSSGDDSEDSKDCDLVGERERDGQPIVEVIDITSSPPNGLDVSALPVNVPMPIVVSSSSNSSSSNSSNSSHHSHHSNHSHHSHSHHSKGSHHSHRHSNSNSSSTGSSVMHTPTRIDT